MKRLTTAIFCGLLALTLSMPAFAQTAAQKDKKEDRKEARKDHREDRKEARKDHKEDRKEARKDHKEDKKEKK